MININQSPTFKRSAGVAGLALFAYLISREFYAMWWWLLLFINVAVAVIFLVVFFDSIFFWILNRRVYHQPYLPLLINGITIIVLFSLPSIHTGKRYFKRSFNLCQYRYSTCGCNLNLYEDDYCAFGGGAMAADLNAAYLTDHKTFNLYLGTYDEADESIIIKINGDTVTAIKTTTRGISTYWNNPIIIERHPYSLYDLKHRIIDVNF